MREQETWSEMTVNGVQMKVTAFVVAVVVAVAFEAVWTDGKLPLLSPYVDACPIQAVLSA